MSEQGQQNAHFDPSGLRIQKPHHLMRPHRHARGTAGYTATVLEAHKDSVRSGIKGDIAVALHEDSKGWRRVSVDRRRHGWADA